jgi:hypothetical protein
MQSPQSVPPVNGLRSLRLCAFAEILKSIRAQYQEFAPTRPGLSSGAV